MTDQRTPDWLPDSLGYGNFRVDNDGDFECTTCLSNGEFFWAEPKDYAFLEQVLGALEDHIEEKHC